MAPGPWPRGIEYRDARLSSGVTATMANWPSALLYVGLFVLGVVRGLGYYAVGLVATTRAAPEGRVAAAQAKVKRFGARSVLFTYPVYGLAAATQVANGAARIRLPRFTAALSLASACWAAVQTLVGVAVWQTLFGG